MFVKIFTRVKMIATRSMSDDRASPSTSSNSPLLNSYNDNNNYNSNNNHNNNNSNKFNDFRHLDDNSLEYHIKFPDNSNDNTNERSTQVPTSPVPVALLLGWAGCQDRYLKKYSKIYENQGYIIPYIFIEREIHKWN